VTDAPARNGDEATTAGGREVFVTDADAVVFGFPATRVRVRIRRRPRSWRLSGAVRRMAIFVVLAPLVAVVPPHAPWLIGALAAGAILARRRWRERFTLETVQGRCPKCGAELGVKAGRLRVPHPVPCEACHHEVSVRVPDAVLNGGQGPRGCPEGPIEVPREPLDAPDPSGT